MPIATGTRYVLVIKRDRDGKWWRKSGGTHPQHWIPMSAADTAAFEGAGKNLLYAFHLVPLHVSMPADVFKAS